MCFCGSSGSMQVSLPLAAQQHFVYHQSMDVTTHPDAAVSAIASAIGEPARARMLYCLMDGHARTSTELAVVAGVTPSTASVHLHQPQSRASRQGNSSGKASLLQSAKRRCRQRARRIVCSRWHFSIEVRSAHTRQSAHGSHLLRPYGRNRKRCCARPPSRAALAYPRLCARRVSRLRRELHLEQQAFESLGIDLHATQSLRRRFACPCLDWSERRPHLGGALGAALLKLALKRKWVIQELDSRALNVTIAGSPRDCAPGLACNSDRPSAIQRQRNISTVKK